MFKQLMAIDVFDIPNFNERIMRFTHNAPIMGMAESDAKDGDLSSVDGLLVSIFTPISESFLKRLVNLRAIFVFGTSTKKLPLAYCSANNIKVVPVTEYCDDETAEWVMMEMLLYVRKNQRSLVNKKLGVIGVGAVGKKVLALGHAFHMETFYNATRPHAELDKLPSTYLEKEEIFASCDVISLHTPAHTPWLTEELLKKTKPQAIIINTCMGRISKDFDLENVLFARSDIAPIMDKIAAQAYPTIISRGHDSSMAAYLTEDSKNRLIEKFFSNLETCF